MEEMKIIPRILNGIAIADEIKAEVAIEVKALEDRGNHSGAGSDSGGRSACVADLRSQQNKDLRRVGNLQRDADAARERYDQRDAGAGGGV